jgi:hypothetical protein
MLVAAFSLAGYLIGRCGVIDFYTMRYELLSVLGAVGLTGWYLRVERSRAIAAVWARAAASALHTPTSMIAYTRRAAGVETDLIRALDAPRPLRLWRLGRRTILAVS